MNLTATLVYMSIALLIALFANIMERRPKKPFAAPLMPWSLIQFFAVMAAILLAAHVVSLLTGQPLRGRTGFP